jgi:hypothetical protein
MADHTSDEAKGNALQVSESPDIPNESLTVTPQKQSLSDLFTIVGMSQPKVFQANSIRLLLVLHSYRMDISTIS